MHFPNSRLATHIVPFVIWLVQIAPLSGQDLERQLQPIVTEIVNGADKIGLQRLTVADLTDLQGQVTELGRYLAEELSTSLVMANPGFGLVDRSNLRMILKEHKLSMSGLVNPDTAKKLGQIAGVDGIVTGTITPLSDSIKLTVKVLAIDTAMVVAAARTTLAKTPAIESLLGRGVSPDEYGAGWASSDSERHGRSSRDGPTANDASGVQDAASGSSQRVFDTEYFTVLIRSFTMGADGRIRVGLVIENLTEQDISLAIDRVRLVDVKTGEQQNLTRSDGIRRGFFNNVQFSPGVPGLATLEFYDSRMPGSLFDLTGTFKLSIQGRQAEFPFTYSGLTLHH